jgi:hypothetical protein
MANPSSTSQDPTAGKGPVGAVPPLDARTAVGVFARAEQVEAAISALRSAGVPDESISYVRQAEAPPLSAEETRAGSGTVVGASAGAVLGGLAGLTALAIPGIGPLIALGPLVAALSGAVAGGALGGLVGSFAGLGIPKEHAQRYEAAVRSGGIFLSVKAPDPESGERIERLLADHGADHVSTYTPAL